MPKVTERSHTTTRTVVLRCKERRVSRNSKAGGKAAIST